MSAGIGLRRVGAVPGPPLDRGRNLVGVGALLQADRDAARLRDSGEREHRAEREQDEDETAGHAGVTFTTIAGEAAPLTSRR